MSKASTMQVGGVARNEPQAHSLMGFVSAFLRVGSAARALDTEPSRPRAAAATQEPRYGLTAGQDGEAVVKRLYDAWLV